MGRKSVRRRFSYKTSTWLTLVLVIFLTGTVAYKGFQGAHVLGESTLLVDNVAPPPPGAPPSGESQPQAPPQQQSQPAQQAPPGGQQQSQQQQNQPQPPQQQGNQSQPSPLQNNTNNFQPEQGKQYQQFQQQYQQGNQPIQSQTQQNNQNNNQFNGGTPQAVPAQYQQQYQQFQQQFRQEAAKNGVQFNGSLPPQLQQFQSQQEANGQQGLNSNQNNQTGSQNTPLQLNSNFKSLPPPTDFPTITGKLDAQTSNNGVVINLNDINTNIQLGNANSNLTINAKTTNGTVVTINDDQLQKINTAMFTETGATIANGNGSVLFKRDGIEAQTKLPISFNIASKTFTVQSPSGETEIKVFPDQVVQKLLQSNIISQLQENTSSQNQQTAQGANASVQAPVTLTEFNNQSVYRVNGISQKKFLGFVPLSIPKTTFISAQSGDIVQTNESLFNRFLDTVSK